MEFYQFRDLIRDALTHLYDGPYLETHPLTDTIATNRNGEVRGRILQQALLDAIKALKPSAELPYESLPWRKYRYLYLRYVQAISTNEIAGDLGISPRQCRRYALESLDALARILWDRYRPTRPDDERDGARLVRMRPRSTSPTVALIKQEVARLGTQMMGDTAPLGEVVHGVIETLRPLASLRGTRLGFVATEMPLSSAAIERTVLRQALLSVLTLCLEMGARSINLSLAQGADQYNARIVIQAALAPNGNATARYFQENQRSQIARGLLQPNHGRLEVRSVGPNDLCAELTVPSVERVRVMVVEDNPDAVQLFHRFVRDSPFWLLTANNGAEAIQLARQERPSAILLDVMMPGQDGWEILQLLKCAPETADIPVIICSVLKERELALALGATDFLPKPVIRAELLAALDRCSQRD